MTIMPFKVIQGYRFWYQSKAHNICDFLLMINTNSSPILHRFQDGWLSISNNSYLVWQARDWSKPPSVNLQRHMRGRWLNDDVVLGRLFTLFTAPSSAVSATSDTAGKFAIGQGVLSSCGMTDNRAVFLDTVTTRHYSAPRQWWLKQVSIMSQR